MANASKQKTPKEICLIDGCGGSKKLVRGLCQKHYTQFKRQFDSIEEGKREVFETKLIETGKLLPEKKSGRKPDEGNPFKELAFEMGFLAAETASEYKTGKPSMDTEHAARSAEAQRKAAPYAKPKPGTETETEKKLKPKKNSG